MPDCSNPYSALLQAVGEYIGEHNAARACLGTVTSVSPLRIAMQGLSLDGKALRRNPDIRNLEHGDTVLLFPLEDGQIFLMLCKVVSA